MVPQGVWNYGVNFVPRVITRLSTHGKNQRLELKVTKY